MEDRNARVVGGMYVIDYQHYGAIASGRDQCFQKCVR